MIFQASNTTTGPEGPAALFKLPLDFPSLAVHEAASDFLNPHNLKDQQHHEYRTIAAPAASRT